MKPFGIRVVLFGFLVSFGATGAEPAAAVKAAPVRAAQPTGPLVGPVVGFLTSEAPVQIRAIRGVPGAAVASEPLPLPEGVSRIRVAPGHRYAILEFSESALPAILDLENGGDPLGIAGTMTRADAIEFSPLGRSAVLYSAAQERLQVLTNLPRESRMVRELPLAEASRVAVSDDGERLLVASSSGAVDFISPDGSAAPVFQASGLPIIAFLPNRGEAVVCDGERGEVYLLGDLDGARSRRLLASGLAGVSGIALSPDGSTIVAVAAEPGRAWLIDVASGAARTFGLAVRPEFLAALRLPGSFLISSRADEPAWLLIPGDGEVRAYFVPAVPKAGLGEDQ